MAKITDEQVTEMMRLRREGKSTSEIARTVGCHRQTVRAYLRERRSSILADEVRKEVLKEALLGHFRELADFAGKELVHRFKFSYPEGQHILVGLLGLPGVGSPFYMTNEWERIYEPALRGSALQKALKEHTGYSPVWRYWDEWEYIVGQYAVTSADLRDWLTGKTEVPEIYFVVNRDDLNKIQKWLFGNVLRLAGGESYSGLSIMKTGSRVELRCSCNGAVVAEVKNAEDAKVLASRLGDILKEAQGLDLLNELQEAMKEVEGRKDELKEIAIKAISELEILGMKRAFPDRCHLCPI
jgi:hypothetical protein